MSPEQASGAPLDPRSDMFSVGVVLYEMVTGRRPFDGTTRQELLAALLGAEPLPPSKHNDSVGPELDRLILQCLRKKPEERLASAVDLLSGLEGSAALPRRSRKRARGALLVSAGALAAAAVVMSIVPRHVQPVPAIASTEVASAAAAPAPVVTRIIDLPPPATQVPAAAAAYAAGLQAVHDDNWFKALGLFTQAAQLDPTMAAAHLYLSLGSLVMNSPPTRRAEYEKAAGLRAQLSDRDRALLEALQPLLQSATQDVDEGDRRLRALTARYPGDVEIWTLLGAIHYVTSASLAPSERALELDPGDAQSIEDKGHAALVLGKYADARGDYARCGSLTIDGADCFAWSGIAYGLEGQCADYEREERRAADRNPFWGLAVLWAMASTGRNATTLEETEKQALAALPPPLNDAAPYFGAGIEVRLAILSGDFARAAVLAKQESAIVAAVPELRDTYTPHYDLTSQLLEIALETGDDAGARRLVSDFLAHSDAWPFEALLGHGVDLSLYFARLALPNGQPPPDFEVQRTAWTQRALFAGADRGQVWDYAYASPALTPSEAETALAALPAWGPPSPAPANIDNFFGRMGSPEADLGRVYLLAGQVEQAIEHLTRAVARCDLYTSTLDHLRAALNLGTALEQKGDTKGACDAYGKVLAQWGHAKPKSVTADAARGRAKALGCSGL
jgi:serine/threonine-protein kinase